MARDFKQKKDADLYKKMDPYMRSAINETYETLRDIIYGLLEDDADRQYAAFIL